MSKKNNIEELFKDSMDDFRVDPPKETSKKILLGLFWSNILYHYKGAILVSLSAIIAGIGALLYFNETAENTIANKVENAVVASSASKKDDANINSNTTPNTKTQFDSQLAKNETNNGNQVISSTSNNAGFTAKSNKSGVQINKQQSIKRKSATTVYGTGAKEIATEKARKNKIKYVPFLDNESKGTSTSARQKEELIGPYGYMGEEGSEERKEYNERLQAGDFLPQIGASEELNKVDDSKKDSTIYFLLQDQMRKSLAAADSSKTDSLVATKDSVSNKKKSPLTFFVGAGFSAVNWQLSHQEYKYSPSITGEINFGAQYKDVLLFSGLGYDQQKLTLDTRVWSTNDSELVEVPLLYYDTLTKKDTTKYVMEMQSVLNWHSASDGRSITLNYLYVPLQLGYAYRFQKHQVMLKAGVGMHFLTSSTQTDSPTDTSGLASMGTPLFEPKKFLLDYNVHLNYGYNFTSHILVMAGVSVKQNLGDQVLVLQQYTNSPYRPLGIGGSLQFIYKF